MKAASMFSLSKALPRVLARYDRRNSLRLSSFGNFRKCLSTSSVTPETQDDKDKDEFPYHHRTWTAGNPPQFWTQRFIDREDEETILSKIEDQEYEGGRMKAQQLGVLSDDPATDMELLTQNYSATSLASALRDREEALQQAAVLAANGEIEQLKKFLAIFHPQLVLDRRIRRRPLELLERLDDHGLEWIRKRLMRMPRNVVSAHAKRAGVVIALCTVEGVPCIMLEKRAPNLRAHADEVCLPGGMVCEISDDTIVATCLREMHEEIGGLPKAVNVLGVYVVEEYVVARKIEKQTLTILIPCHPQLSHELGRPTPSCGSGSYACRVLLGRIATESSPQPR